MLLKFWRVSRHCDEVRRCNEGAHHVCNNCMLVLIFPIALLLLSFQITVIPETDRSQLLNISYQAILICTSTILSSKERFKFIIAQLSLHPFAEANYFGIQANSNQAIFNPANSIHLQSLTTLVYKRSATIHT